MTNLAFMACMEAIFPRHKAQPVQTIIMSQPIRFYFVSFLEAARVQVHPLRSGQDGALEFTGASPAQNLKILDNGGACPDPMASMYYG